uniref:DNA-directed RNA polymerase n=1 Tax=Salix viminalis TaxID=40686 RepID=A0A6N2KB81_SALVM
MGEINHYCLASDRRDCNYLPPFEKPDHLKISGKPPQTRQNRRTVPPPSTVGSSLFLSIVFALVVTTYSPKGFSWFFSVRGEYSFEENSEICFLLPVRVACYFRFISPLDEAEIWHVERVCIKFIALSFELFQTSCKNPLAAAIASICDQTMAFSSQSVMHAVLCECLKKLWQNTLKAVFSSGNGSSILFSYVGVSVLFWFGCAILTVMCVAVNVHLGYNQADSLVMKRASLERGMFRSEHTRSYKAKVDNRELTDKRQKSEDSITFGKIQSKMDGLTVLMDDGFPFIGVNMQSAHYCLASDRRDCNYLPPFEKPDHLKISGKPPQTRQNRRTVPPPSTVGSSLFLSIVFALVVTTYSPKGFSWFFSVRGEYSFEENSEICFLLPVRVACYFRFISPLDEAEIWVCGATEYD